MNKKTMKAKPSQLKAGLARLDITPPLGGSLVGAFGDRKSDGIYDNLYVRALVLNDGRMEVAIVSCDLCFLGTPEVGKVRKLASAQTGIPEKHILVCATHTHTGPQVNKVFLGVGEIDRAYMDVLTRKIADAIFLAKSRLQQARIGMGAGEINNLFFSRRLRMPDNMVVMSWGDAKRLKGAVPAGPVDPEIGVIRIDDLKGNPLGILVNYACHSCTVGGRMISGDVPGLVSEVMNKSAKNNLMVAYLGGACGNVIFGNYKGLRGYELGHALANVLAAQIWKILKGIKTSGKCRLEVEDRIINIPDRPAAYAREQLRKGSTAMVWGSKATRDAVEKHYEKEALYLSRKKREQVPVEIQAIGINDSVIITNPAELFVEFGLALKKESPFKHTFVVELGNGYAGYVPTRAAFREGGYEVRQTAKTSRLIPEAGDMIVKTSVNMMGKLHRRTK